MEVGAASAGSEESGVGQGEGQRWSSHLDLGRAGTWKRAVACGSEVIGEWEADDREDGWKQYRNLGRACFHF